MADKYMREMEGKYRAFHVDELGRCVLSSGEITYNNGCRILSTNDIWRTAPDRNTAKKWVDRVHEELIPYKGPVWDKAGE